MKQTRSLSEFSCLFEYTRLYPNLIGICSVWIHNYRYILENDKIHNAIVFFLVYALWLKEINLMQSYKYIIFLIQMFHSINSLKMYLKQQQQNPLFYSLPDSVFKCQNPEFRKSSENVYIRQTWPTMFIVAN